MRHLVLSLGLLLGLQACASPATSTDTCTAADALDAGVAVATVDGAAWTSTGTWIWQGQSLQLTTNPADGWRFTLVAQVTGDGTTLKAAADEGAFPITVSLGESGAWALVYPTDGDSYDSRSAGGGTLTVTAIDEDLYACFDFSAATDGGDTVDMTAGALRAIPF